MNQHTFDVLTRRVVVHDRRRSLQAVGVAAVLAAIPFVADAGKAGKKAKKKCKKQVGACQQVFDAFCEGSMGAQECFEAAAECCAFLRGCNAGAAIDCIIEKFFASG
jgi:hypothetical protein